MTDRQTWIAHAIEMLRAEQQSLPDTALIPVALAGAPGISLFLKDESEHPTGSLKHRLASSLFLHALCNGWIGPDSIIIESSSGSTAVSEAYFARRLGLPFIAVIPVSTTAEKIAAIEQQGGSCRFIDNPRDAHDEAVRVAQETGGIFLDQFAYAERATDWRGDNNIAASIFRQIAERGSPVPRWVVCGAGTGGTSATIGRYIRYHGYATQLCVADPEASVFHRHHADRSVTEVSGPRSCVEGIGRSMVEASFMPDVIDRMIAVADADSFAAARHLSRIIGKRCGPSTGANLVACLTLVSEMAAAGEAGSIVTLLCDPGERYATTCYNDSWIEAFGRPTSRCVDLFDHFLPLTSSVSAAA